MPSLPKTYIFYDGRDQTLINFKLQLGYDNLTQAKFFSYIIRGYLDRDNRIISLLEEKNNTNPSKVKRNKDLQKTNQIIYDFNLEENEVNDIFDVLAKENPDL